MSKYNTYVMTKSEERVDFVLDVGKRQKYALAVQEGKLIVRVPLYFDKKYVPQLIENNIEWIHKCVNKSAERAGLPLTFDNGESIRILGDNIVIFYKQTKNYCEPFISDGRLVVSVCPTSDRTYMVNEVNRFIITLAENEVKESMDRLTKLMNLYPVKVTLKSMTASWGRCSSDKNISINYKLITYSKECCDYVCIHELSHLVHMNHSREFWKLVSKYCPNYNEIQAMMKDT